MKLPGILTLALGMIPGRASGDGENPEKTTLYFFFSERSTGGAQTARAVAAFLKAHPGEIALRPALLVEDWTGLGRLTEDAPLYRTVRGLGEGTPIQVYDPEVLRLAGAWKITRLPAVALVKNGKTHLIQGSGPDLEALWRCMP